MADLLREAMGFLDTELKAHASHSVVYSQRSVAVTVSAQVGFSKLAVSGGDGEASIVRTDRDFLISVADLINGSGGRIIPAEGDEVAEVVGGKTFRYRVEKPTTGDNCWRYSDPYHKRYRIHTRALTVT